jgi:hypothetical protein
LVVAEDDVEYRMEAVLDAPVAADGLVRIDPPSIAA